MSGRPRGADRVPEDAFLTERRLRGLAQGDARGWREAHADAQRLLAAVLRHVGGEVAVSTASLVTVAFTSRITTTPEAGGGITVRLVSEPPENPWSDPDRAGPDDECEDPDGDSLDRERPHGRRGAGGS